MFGIQDYESTSVLLEGAFSNKRHFSKPKTMKISDECANFKGPNQLGLRVEPELTLQCTLMAAEFTSFGDQRKFAVSC